MKFTNYQIVKVGVILKKGAETLLAHCFWQFYSHEMKICLGGPYIIKVTRWIY